MSTTVVLPLVPVTAATRTRGPTNSSPKPTSETTGRPRSAAALSTGCPGCTPGLAMRRPAPSRTSGPAPRCPSTPSSRILERRRLSLRSSATTTCSPRATSARAAATPDSPSPYTRVATASPRPVVEKDVVEEKPHRRESGLGDPEPDDHLVLVPAEKLEVVVYGGHLEHPSSRKLEDEHLDDNGEGLDDEQPAHDGKQELSLGEHRRGREDTPYRERTRIPHKDVGRVGVVPEEPDDRPDHRAADHGDVVLALEERDGRVGEQGYGRRPGGEPVEAVRKVDGVGRAGDHQQQEHAEERYPQDPGPQDQAAVEIRHEHGLGDADVANRQDVRQNHREGEQEELVAGAQPFGALFGDLLPVVVEAYARNDGDEQERRERGHGRPRHHSERREEAGKHDDPTHGRGAGFDQVGLRSFFADELPELPRLQELDELRAEQDRSEKRYGRREYNAKQELDSPSTCGSGCRVRPLV